MFQTLLVSCLLLTTLVAAQTYEPTLPDQTTTLLSTDPLCNTSEFKTAPWVQTMFTEYTSGFSTGAKGVCYLDNSITPCATLAGAVGCNKYNEKCTSINSSIDITSTVLHPEIVGAMTQRPSVCVSEGSFFHPDAIVFVIVLIIIGWLILVALLVYVMKAFKALRPGFFLNAVVIVSFVLCTLLLFSYYYLNAILVLGCVYVAYMLFSVRRTDCTAFGFLIIVGGMLWTMHASALGWVQHMGRFTSNATNATVDMCLNYYRGYFSYPDSLRGDFENPIVNSKDFCRREWLGAELFFMILLQLVLLLAVVAGAAARNTITPVKQVKVREADAQESF